MAASCWPDSGAQRFSRSATMTSRSTRSAARTWATCSDFERDFAVENVIKLEQNYRSHGHILDAANALIKHNRKRLGKNLWTDEARASRCAFMRRASDLRRGALHRRGSRRPCISEGVARCRDRRCSTARTRSRACSNMRLFNAGIALPRLWRPALFRARRKSSTRSPICA